MNEGYYQGLPGDRLPGGRSAVAEDLELASLGQRFAGGMIDLLLGLGLLVLASVFFGDTLFTSLLAFTVSVLIHYPFLKATGQSIGKKVMGTRIVTMDDRKPPVIDLWFNRMAVMYLIGWIPVVGVPIVLVGLFMVFRDDRRALHDFITGTRVVKIRPGEVVS